MALLPQYSPSGTGPNPGHPEPPLRPEHGLRQEENATALAPEVTRLLSRWCNGDSAALAQLTPILYSELRLLARSHLRQERSSHTLQPTALVHEAYCRLVDQNRMHWENRRQFFAVASLMMRRILVDYARRREAARRDFGADLVPLDRVLDCVSQKRSVDLIALDEALDILAESKPLQSRVVDLRYFMGLTIEETAEAMEISTATVKRYWAQARAYLKQYLLD